MAKKEKKLKLTKNKMAIFVEISKKTYCLEITRKDIEDVLDVIVQNHGSIKVFPKEFEMVSLTVNMNK